MTLTIGDLKSIEKVTREIVREEVEAEGENIRTEIGSEIKLAGIRTTTELQEVNTRLKNLEIGVRKVQKDIKEGTDFLDRENLKTVKRVSRIEKHLGISEPTII